MNTPTQPSPAPEMPKPPMPLVYLDLETTGLSPQTDLILEIAISVADLDHPFDAKPAYHAVFSLPTSFQLSPFIVDMHTKNGLLAECAASKSFPWNAEAELLTMFPELPKDEETGRAGLYALAGNSVHFDLGFLRASMPKLAKRFSHRLYDVSAVGLFCRSLGMPKFKKAEAHRAKDDVLESIEMARSCAQWLRKVGPRKLTQEEAEANVDCDATISPTTGASAILTFTCVACGKKTKSVNTNGPIGWNSGWWKGVEGTFYTCSMFCLDLYSRSPELKALQDAAAPEERPLTPEEILSTWRKV